MIANNFQGKEGQAVPEMSEEWVNEISNRYIELYEKISGEKFVRHEAKDLAQRVETNINTYLQTLN